MLLAKRNYAKRNGLFGYDFFKFNSLDEIIRTLIEEQKKTSYEGAPFVVYNVSEKLFEEMKIPKEYDEFDRFTDKVSLLAVPIIGFAGNNPKKPDKEINISSEMSRVNGRFLISPDGNRITYESLYRFNNERDSYVYTGANDVYYTDRTMSEIMKPILNNACQFYNYDFAKHERKPISKEEMMEIYNKMVGDIDRKDNKTIETL